MPTRLSTLHPYPAMIADSLAEQLVDRFVSSNMRVLDPFCGTGRIMLAAANKGAKCIGIDVNPLAFILVEAKSKLYNLIEINKLLLEIERRNLHNSKGNEFDFEYQRKVEWFSKRAKRELSDLIIFLNSYKQSKSIGILSGAVLSATAREVSYCRNDRWKLHRIPRIKREQHNPSAIEIFIRRLRSVAEEIRQFPSVPANCSVLIGDSRNMKAVLESKNEFKPFDMVISSPPYGDSYTTVQYGGMSSLCLGVVSHLKGLEHLRATGREIDGKCLGGKITIENDFLDFAHDRYLSYWRGSRKNPSCVRVYQYLHDLEMVCSQISRVLRNGGYAIMIVARRRIGNWRVYLDKFIEDVFNDLGLAIYKKESRKIIKKLLPFQINRYAHSNNIYKFNNNRILTMSQEFVLVFQKK